MVEHHLCVITTPPPAVAMPPAAARRPVFSQLLHRLPAPPAAMSVDCAGRAWFGVRAHRVFPEQKMSGTEKPSCSGSRPVQDRTNSSISGPAINSAKHGAQNAGW